MRPRIFVKVPPERIGAVIGSGGSVKREIASRLGVSISVDTENSMVIVEGDPGTVSPVNVMKAAEIVKAIAYGFPHDKAMSLISDDHVLIVIDLKETIGDKESHMKRVKGRIIGEGGKTRKTLEELTGTYIHVGEHHIAIIGEYERAMAAREAIQMLIEGRMHSTVYKHLESVMRGVRKRERLKMWG
ncbi:MAG: KH domain-containing protein [Thermoprotei archaeon]|nr:KH domain-containing protein [Thermoprotei archaeon]